MIHDQEHNVMRTDDELHRFVKDAVVNPFAGKKEEPNHDVESEYEEEGDNMGQSILDKYNKTVALKLDEKESQNLGNSTKKRKKDKKEENPPKK